MKSILTAAIIILYAAGVNAQPGMPKELSCTETAFNFSFSLGAKWKFSTPKMGPADVITNVSYYDIPAWSLKVNNVTPEKPVLPLFNLPLNADVLGYAAKKSNYSFLFRPDSVKINKPGYSISSIN